MEINIEKIPGGFKVDGLELKNGKCGCTSILPCCHSFSKVKRSGNQFIFTAKAANPETKDIFKWGYKVRKGDYSVEVSFEDARDKKIFSGFYPPSLKDWMDKGWVAVSSENDKEEGTLWRCAMCRWLYKEKEQDAPFNDLPPEWKCPVCHASKSSFEDIS